MGAAARLPRRVDVLKPSRAEPFHGAMSAIPSSLLSHQLDIAVAKKQLDAIQQQGKDALTLIAAASPAGDIAPPANLPEGVGARLNVTA